MRICIFTDSFLPYCSGVTFAVMRQANGLSRRGHKVSIFRPRPPRRRRAERDELLASVDVLDVPFAAPAVGVPGLHLAMPTVFSSLLRLWRMRPDVVHISSEWGCGWEGLLAARMLRVPVVGTFHTFFAEPGYLKAMGLPPSRLMANAMWRYSVFFYNRCNAITSPSRVVKDALARHGVQRDIHLISNGMDKLTWRCASDIKALRNEHGVDGPSFVYVGRLSAEKSLDTLLLAFRQVVRRMPQASLVLIGDGPYRRKVDDLIASLQIKNNVRTLGYVAHQQLIERNLPRMGDVFVTASTTENQPVSILEAMALGRPVVGPRAKGIPELVTHGRNGFLFAPDDVRAMARWMTELAQSPELCRRMGHAAMDATSEHHLDRVVTKLEQVYTKASESAKRADTRIRGRATADTPIVS